MLKWFPKWNEENENDTSADEGEQQAWDLKRENDSIISQVSWQPRSLDLGVNFPFIFSLYLARQGTFSFWKFNHLHWRSFQCLSTWPCSGTWGIQRANEYLHPQICIGKNDKTTLYHPKQSIRQMCEIQTEKSQLYNTSCLLLQHLSL